MISPSPAAKATQRRKPSGTWNSRASCVASPTSLVPIRLKVATEPALQQTVNTASTTAKGATARSLPQGFGIRSCLHPEREQLGDCLTGDRRDGVVDQFAN